MNVQVLVPHRGREASLERHLKQWDELGWTCHVADCEDEVFTRAIALNTAAERATDADVLIITDVDMVLENPAQAYIAAEIALHDYCYVCTFTVMHSLTRAGTKALYAGKLPRSNQINDQVAMIWGAPAAVPRALWDQVGGMDPRFHGYGHEDLAFLAATDAYGGPKRRVEGIAWHMWHEPNPYKNWNHQNGSLASRYRDANGNQRKVRKIIEERT